MYAYLSVLRFWKDLVSLVLNDDEVKEYGRLSIGLTSLLRFKDDAYFGDINGLCRIIA